MPYKLSSDIYKMNSHSLETSHNMKNLIRTITKNKDLEIDKSLDFEIYDTEDLNPRTSSPQKQPIFYSKIKVWRS